MKVSLKISKYLGIFKRFSPKDRFFQLLQVRVPLQSILIFVYSESQITASSQGTGIVAGNPNQTRVRFWSGVLIKLNNYHGQLVTINQPDKYLCSYGNQTHLSLGISIRSWR